MTRQMRSRPLSKARYWVVAVLVLAMAVAHPGRAQTPKKDEQFATSTPFAILIDSDSGTVLYEKNDDRLVDPESMAKLITVQLVFSKLKQSGIKPSDRVNIIQN